MARGRMDRYIIETLSEHGIWSTDGLGAYSLEDAMFLTVREARAAVASLRRLGDDWHRAQFRIRDLRNEARHIPLNA